MNNKWNHSQAPTSRLAWTLATDWSNRDADIARIVGLSRERIRQIRAELGIPSSREIRSRAQAEERRYMEGRVLGAIVFYGDIARRWGGDERLVSPRLVSEVTNVPLRSVRAVYKQLNLVCAPHLSAHLNSFRFNWRLPNKFLAEVWRLPRYRISQARCDLKLGSAAFDIRFGVTRADDHAELMYVVLIEQEKARAAFPIPS